MHEKRRHTAIGHWDPLRHSEKRRHTAIGHWDPLRQSESSATLCVMKTMNKVYVVDPAVNVVDVELIVDPIDIDHDIDLLGLTLALFLC